MFTGIVEEVGKVGSVQPGGLVIAASKVLQGVEPGGSIAVNGVCLTVTNFDSDSFSVDIMSETLERTNLGLLGVGDEVNLERPLTPEKQLGGHFVQGHIDDTGRVTSVNWDGTAMLIRVEAPAQAMRYIVKKGFIAVDGVSLTIVDCDAGSFLVSIVDYTREHTILGSKEVGDLVNLEVDIIAKYLERLSQAHTSGITIDFLKEHGFLLA
ncbi:MAG: riboflavin synthase [Dehalococcoidales bacterium]